MWQWKKFENRLIFGYENDMENDSGTYLGPPCTFPFWQLQHVFLSMYCGWLECPACFSPYHQTFSSYFLVPFHYFDMLCVFAEWRWRTISTSLDGTRRSSSSSSANHDYNHHQHHHNQSSSCGCVTGRTRSSCIFLSLNLVAGSRAVFSCTWLAAAGRVETTVGALVVPSMAPSTNNCNLYLIHPFVGRWSIHTVGRTSPFWRNVIEKNSARVTDAAGMLSRC